MILVDTAFTLTSIGEERFKEFLPKNRDECVKRRRNQKGQNGNENWNWIKNERT